MFPADMAATDVAATMRVLGREIDALELPVETAARLRHLLSIAHHNLSELIETAIPGEPMDHPEKPGGNVVPFRRHGSI